MGLLCVIYVSTAALGLSLDAVSGIAAVVWPPTGIALAAMTLYGTRFWPGITLGALLLIYGLVPLCPPPVELPSGIPLKRCLGHFSCVVWLDSVQPWIAYRMSLDSSFWRQV